MKIKISERAVIQRINRKLAKDNEKLKTLHETSQSIHNIGRHYIVDIYSGAILHTHQDVESLGREIGVLHNREKIAEE